MKRLILLLFPTFFFTQLLFSQDAPPQAVCYQAVATDSDGRELMGANLTIRASILAGSAVGTVIYQETHQVETDNFGLFNINIGEGTITGGNPFAEINWGGSTYFLRMEMDPVAGNNFVDLGTSQILSVPYALYAGRSAVSDSTLVAATAGTALDDFDTDPENEIQELVYDQTTGDLTLTGGAVSINIPVEDDDSDPLNEIQSLDYDGSTLTLTGPLGGSSVTFEDFLFRGPGASFDYPQGIMGEHIALGLGFFTVPQGMVFYMTGSEEDVQFSHPEVAGGALITNHSSTPNMPIFKAGTVLTNCRCTGFMVEENDMVEPVFLELTDLNASYLVPQGKTLFIKSGLANDFSGFLRVNNLDIEFFRPNLSRWTRVLTFPEATALGRPAQTPNSMDSFILTGFLIDN